MTTPKTAPQPAENFWAQVDAMRSELAADIRDVFDANGPETPQIVRDVIEYADSWLQVAIQRESERSARPQPPAGIWVPTELAERVQETMGEFLMDHGWRQQDMNTSDEFGALLAVATKAEPSQQPIDMVLHCPACGLQHVDAREYQHGDYTAQNESAAWDWDNPPHRSHLCHGCGHIWRPADVPTNGVKAVKTAGKADSPIMGRVQQPERAPLTWEQISEGIVACGCGIGGGQFPEIAFSRGVRWAEKHHVKSSHDEIAALPATAPKAAKAEPVPLTDDEIGQCLPLGVIAYSTLMGADEIRAFVRAIEQVHGIKPREQTNV